MKIISIIEDGEGKVIGVRYVDETTEAIPETDQPTRAALEAEPGPVVDSVASLLAE